MQKITPFLWFDSQAEEATNFYVSTFKNSKVLNVTRRDALEPGGTGGVLFTTFELDGVEFMALNGGPYHTFTLATSFFVTCETQEEIDELWAKLSEGGKEIQCGWVTDRFGVTWQIVPKALGELMSSGTPEQSARVYQAMLQMVKLDIATLRRAFEGR